ncbi:MAG: EAL domain-containing protein [Treponema sp.]|nr:EAL domain-containing protein [Treponema sp.]
MSSSNYKKIRKVKRNHIWLRIILLIILFSVIFMMTKLFFYFIGNYLLRTKMTSEYVLISEMARIYENGSKQNPEENIYDILDSMNRDYLIKNSEGTIIHSNGAITISDEMTSLALTTDFNYVEVYKDKINYFMMDEEGDVSIDYKTLFWRIVKNEKVVVQLETDGHIDRLNMQLLNNSINETIRLPIWISFPVNENQDKFIGKAFFSINLMDYSLFVSFLFLIIGLGVVLGLFGLFGIIHEIRHYFKSKKLLFSDDVTKGYNYTWFLYKSRRILEKKKNAQSTFAVIDLLFVNFRTFCACHSVKEGEKQIKILHDSLKNELKKNEIVAHSTPSNFVLLLNCSDGEQIKARVLDLIGKLEKLSKEHSFKFHAGIGIVDVRKNSKGKIVRRKKINPDIEYNNACTACATLNDSEDSGVAIFDEKLIEEQKWISIVQEEQMSALMNEEFMVYYQPKYNPGTEKLCGAEALIRWQSPKHGFISPGRFIPIFEKNGFITEIDHYMLSHVANDMKRWQDAGLNCVPVSVNFSRAHFIETDLAEQIMDMVDKAGADRSLIEIELTESAFFDDKKVLINTINRLKEYGFAVSMDDFGSGYSSLNSLKDMPLDILKIDAEFFRGESADTRGKIVVSETIKLAKSLNMRTVAEGVEIKEQVDFLAEQGCDMIQGFYFAKPMPKDEFEDRMK